MRPSEQILRSSMTSRRILKRMSTVKSIKPNVSTPAKSPAKVRRYNTCSRGRIATPVSSDTCTQYEWRTLNQSNNELRLLELSDDLNDCALLHYSLTRLPEYVALSYCWGTKSRDFSINVDSLSFHVTKNLHAALSALHARGHRRLWIDAICIDPPSV